jgi:hypothetical protein
VTLFARVQPVAPGDGLTALPCCLAAARRGDAGRLPRLQALPVLLIRPFLAGLGQLVEEEEDAVVGEAHLSWAGETTVVPRQAPPPLMRPASEME